VKQGNFQDAISELNNYIELNPANAEAYIKRAMVHELLGQPVERNQDLAFAKYLNPFANMYISMSSRFRFFEKKQYEYEFNRDNLTFKKSPVKPNYYDKYLDEILDLHSQDSMLTEAIYALSLNDIQKTEQIISQVNTSEKSLGIIYDIKGLISLKKNDISQSIEYFTKSIEAMPNFPLAYHNRAIAYKLANQLDKAKKDLKTAISLNEDISVFYFTLAKLNELSGDEENTIINYNKAINKNPNYLEARNNYTLIQKTLGNYEGALADLNIVLDNNTDKIENHFIQGGIALTYGEYESAIDEFDNYLAYHEKDSGAIFNRGLAKILLGTTKDGCVDISRSIDIEENKSRQEIYIAFCSQL